jgi:hypothetical protein
MKAKILCAAFYAAAVLAGSSAIHAASVTNSETNVVTTRPDQDVQQQYGRDSVYAFSPNAKPLKPEQTGSRDLKSYGAEAWHKTQDAGRWVWDHTLGYVFK